MNLRNSIVNRKHRFWIFQTAGWLIYGFIDLYADSQMTGPETMTSRHIVAWFLSLLIGFLLALLMRQIYRALYKKSYSIITYALVSVICSLIGSLIWLTLKDVTELLLKMGMPYSIWTMRSESGFSDYLMVNLLLLSSPLFAWSFLYFGYKLIEDLQTEKSKYQETLLLAKEAQLQMLRYQVNPHFLFNTLNSIQALMYKKTVLADEMLSEFSEFLRYTLERHDGLYAELSHEIEMISKYLYIEKIRFQEKLKYSIHISDNTRQIKVLTFLLQPIVENAIKHGLSTSKEILKIEISSTLRDRSLEIMIKNSGKWKNDASHNGIGLVNVRDRLKNAYTDRHILHIEERNGWVIVKIQIDLEDD